MRVVILAGGKGTRLRPYTTVLPKPLMPVGDMPILEILIRQLVDSGATHVTIAVGYLANLIQAFFGDGARFGIKIDYSFEERPLGTMGPLRLIENLPENFLVINGDVLTDLDFGRFFELHCKAHSIYTISSYRRQLHSDFGVLHVNDQGMLTGFEEKPKYDLEVSMGVYAMNRAAIDAIPAGVPFGFDHLMLKLIDQKRLPRVLCHDGQWLDIGRTDDYDKAQDLIARLNTRAARNAESDRGHSRDLRPSQ